MAVDRRTPTTLNHGPSIGGSAYADAVNEEVGALWNATTVYLHTIGGTANAITASATPALDAYAKGQGWILVPALNNSGPVVLNIDAKGNRAITLRDGSPLSGGEMQAGDQIQLIDDGTKFRIQSGESVSTADSLEPVMICHYQTTIGTNGGTATASSRQNYPLNTVVLNEISGASLNTGSGVVTLPAGTYEAYAIALLYDVEECTILLRNITLGADIGGVTRLTAAANSGSAGEPTLKGKFSLAGTSQIHIQYVCKNTVASYGLGANLNLVGLPEIYGHLWLKKVA